MRGSIVVVMVVVGLLAACTGSADTGVSPVPSVAPTMTVPPTGLPAEALPVPEPSPWQVEPGEKIDRPTSPDVAIGEERSFRLYTHCGIDFRVDFDGSFWQSYAGAARATDNTTRQVGNPTQQGVMTLLSDQVSVFRFEDRRGREATIYLVRNDTPKARGICF